MKKIILQVFFIYTLITSFNIASAFEMATKDDIVLAIHDKSDESKSWGWELAPKFQKRIINYC